MPQIGASGYDYKILNLSLTDAYADVDLPRSTSSFAIQIRNNAKILWRRSASLTDEWTFKEGQVYSVDGAMGVKVDETITIGQAKCEAAGATDTMEIWYWFT